jgi:hypothetical protein
MATYTANTLLKSAQKARSYAGAGYPNVEGLYFAQCIPFKGMGSVVYHWQAKPSPIKRNKDGSMPKNAHKPSHYDMYLEFQQVPFAEEGDEIPSDNTWAKIEYKGETYYFEKPSIDKNPIRVRCSCPDFRFTWEKQCWDAHILYGGTYTRYQRKTPEPPIGREHRNSANVPGLCKHVYSAITRSITEGWILGGSTQP